MDVGRVQEDVWAGVFAVRCWQPASSAGNLIHRILHPAAAQTRQRLQQENQADHDDGAGWKDAMPEMFTLGRGESGRGDWFHFTVSPVV